MENKKEIVLKETENLKIKLVINEKSVTFVKEKFDNSTKDQQTTSKMLADVLKDNITTIKYDETTTVEEKGSKASALVFFILAIVILVLGLVLNVSMDGIILGAIVISIILLIVGLINLPSKSESKNYMLQFLDSDNKTIFQVITELDDEKVANIINAVRE